MNNFLIQESAFSASPVISKKNEHTVEFIAVLQEADRPNRNGRIYYKTVLEQALQSPYIQERIRTKSFYLEAGHPSDTSVQRQMTIDQKNIAAILKEFWWEGNLLKGKIETANTSVGRDMKGLIEQGSRVAFSLRAQGNVHFDQSINATIVEAPIQIATYDWVVNPSHDKAFLETICEDTRCSLFGVKESSNRLVLAESINLFENGNLISLTEVTQPVVVDYARNFWKKVKPLSEAYVHAEGDKLAVADKIATVVNGNVTKKVVLEDFLLKDIRSRILKLTESELGDAAAEPVHTDAPAKEHTPDLDNKDILVGQHAEEVEEIIVESEIRKNILDKFTSKVVSNMNSLPNSESYVFEVESSDDINPNDSIEIYALIKPNLKQILPASKIFNNKEDSFDKEFNLIMSRWFEECWKKSNKSGKKYSLKWHNFESIVESEHKLEVSKPEEQQYKVEEEIAPVDSPEAVVKTEVKSGEIVVQAHDHADAEGKQVRDELIQEKQLLKVVKIKKTVNEELGDAAAEPVHADSPAKEHTPDLDNDDILVGQHAEEVEEVIVEARKSLDDLKGPSNKELEHIKKVGTKKYAEEGAKKIPVLKEVKVVKEDISSDEFKDMVKRYPSNQMGVAKEIEKKMPNPSAANEILRDVRGTIVGKGGVAAKNIHSDTNLHKPVKVIKRGY
jgi:hypothetical protein